MMKKIVWLVIVLLVASCMLMACKPDTDAQTDAPKSVTLYVVRGEEELAKYQRTTEAATVADLFYLLANEEDSQFGYGSTTSIYGQFLDSVTISTDAQTLVSEGLFPDATKGEYCAFYHTIDNIDYRDYLIEAKTYNGIEFYFSAVGINGAPLIDGASYLVTVNKY